MTDQIHDVRLPITVSRDLYARIGGCAQARRMGVSSFVRVAIQHEITATHRFHAMFAPSDELASLTGITGEGALRRYGYNCPLPGEELR